MDWPQKQTSAVVPQPSRKTFREILQLLCSRLVTTARKKKTINKMWREICSGRASAANYLQSLIHVVLNRRRSIQSPKTNNSMRWRQKKWKSKTKVIEKQQKQNLQVTYFQSSRLESIFMRFFLCCSCKIKAKNLQRCLFSLFGIRSVSRFKCGRCAYRWREGQRDQGERKAPPKKSSGNKSASN